MAGQPLAHSMSKQKCSCSTPRPCDVLGCCPRPERPPEAAGTARRRLQHAVDAVGGEPFVREKRLAMSLHMRCTLNRFGTLLVQGVLEVVRSKSDRFCHLWCFLGPGAAALGTGRPWRRA